MSITGTIIEISEEELLTDSIRKKAIVLLQEGQFPNELPFELFNEKIALLERFKEGDRVEILFTVRGFSKVNDEGKISRWVSLRPYRITLYETTLQETKIESQAKTEVEQNENVRDVNNAAEESSVQLQEEPKTEAQQNQSLIKTAEEPNNE